MGLGPIHHPERVDGVEQVCDGGHLSDHAPKPPCQVLRGQQEIRGYDLARLLVLEPRHLVEWDDLPDRELQPVGVRDLVAYLDLPRGHVYGHVRVTALAYPYV